MPRMRSQSVAVTDSWLLRANNWGRFSIRTIVPWPVTGERAVARDRVRYHLKYRYGKTEPEIGCVTFSEEQCGQSGYVSSVHTVTE